MTQAGSLFVRLGLKSSEYRKGLQEASRKTQLFEKSIARSRKSLLGFKTLLVGTGAALAGWGMARTADSFIQVGSSMDQMKMSLDTITKGGGEEWFQKINEWAMKMPINTEKSIEAFRMMKAMGLDPTIKDMTTLVDATSALGGSADTLSGISRALGQIKTKGKVSAEELMQLAEQGIPAYQILQEKLSLTADEVRNIGQMGIEGQTAVDALMEGMAERFGGQSEKMQSKFKGLVENLKGYWTEFRRMVMEKGLMDYIESGLGELVEKMDDLYNTGEMEQWAQKVSDTVKTFGDGIMSLGGSLKEWGAASAQGFNVVVESAGAALKAVKVIQTGIMSMYAVMMKVMAAGHELGSQLSPTMSKDKVTADIPANWKTMPSGVEMPALNPRYQSKAKLQQAAKYRQAAEDALWSANKSWEGMQKIDDGIKKITDTVDDYSKSITKVKEDTEQLEDVVVKVNGMWTNMQLPSKEAVVQFKGEGSSVRPLSEKVVEMQGKLKEYGSFAENLSPQITTSFAGSGGSDMSSSIFARMMELNRESAFAQAGYQTQTFGAANIARNAAASAKKQQEIEIAGMMEMVQMMGGGGIGGGGGGMAPIVVNFNDVVVGDVSENTAEKLYHAISEYQRRH